MPRRCSVPGCRSNYRDKWSVGKYVSCYGFPSDPNTLKKWLIAIGRQNFAPNYDNAVCAKHFDASSFLTEDMYRGADGELKVFKFAKPKLKNDSVPSLFLGGSLVRESRVDKSNLSVFGAQNEVMPLSALIDGLQRGGGDVVLRRHDVLEIDDTQTCMDFVEVEMRDPENEGKTLNLGEHLGGSSDLRAANCISSRKHGQHLAKKVKSRDTCGGELQNSNCGVISSRNPCNLVGKRGFSNCAQNVDNPEQDQVVQKFHVRCCNGAAFVDKVMRGSWVGLDTLSSHNPSYHAADAVLDRARKGGGSDGILEDTGSPNGSSDTDGNNHEGAINTNFGDVSSSDGISGGFCYGGNGSKGVQGKENGNLVVMSTANPDNTNDQDGGDGNRGSKNNIQKNQAVQKNCDDSSNDGICGGNGVVGKISSKGVQGKENGNLVVMDAHSSQSYPGETQDFSVGDLVAKVGVGENCGFVKTIKKIQVFRKDCDISGDGNGVVRKKRSKGISCPENGNLVVIDAHSSPSYPGEMHQDFSVGDLDVKVGVGENCGFVKDITKIKVFRKDCDISGGGNGVVRKKEISCLENGNLAHSSQSYPGKTQDFSVGDLAGKVGVGENCGIVKNIKKTQVFREDCDISGGGRKKGISCLENGNLSHSSQSYPGETQDFSVGDLAVKVGVGENCGIEKNIKKTQVFREDCDISGGGRKKGIFCLENGNLVAMDAHSSQSYFGEMQDFSVRDLAVKVEVGENCGIVKNTEKIQVFRKDCDIAGGGNGLVRKKGISRLENGNLAHSSQRYPGEIQDFSVGDLDVKVGVGENCGFVKDIKKIQVFREDCDISGGGRKKGISCLENGDLVLMDANVSQSDGTRDVGVSEVDSEGVSEVKVGGQNRGSEKNGEDEGPSEVQEWEGGRAVKEELFRGLGLVPRGVLHDRSVDRRHCVIGQRRSALSGKRLRSPTKTAVFYPPGTAMFDTEKFIGEIQRRPAIYDVRSKVYSNRVAKLKYWHEVGQEMYEGWDALDQMERRTLVKELQIKWKSIRDHFMRQLKQNMNGEGPKKKKYVHFDQLQFLTANLGVKRPRHSYKPPKHEPEEEYMELTPELPEERHFSFMTSDERPDYDEHEVPVAAALLPQQPEDLSYHPKDLSYHHHKELSYHKELEGDRMGNKMFLLSLLPIMERLPDHSNIRARLQLMEVLQTFVAHEDPSHRDFYNYHDEKQSCGDVSQQHSTASHSDSDS